MKIPPLPEPPLPPAPNRRALRIGARIPPRRSRGTTPLARRIEMSRECAKRVPTDRPGYRARVVARSGAIVRSCRDHAPSIAHRAQHPRRWGRIFRPDVGKVYRESRALGSLIEICKLPRVLRGGNASLRDLDSRYVLLFIYFFSF